MQRGKNFFSFNCLLKITTIMINTRVAHFGLRTVATNLTANATLGEEVYVATSRRSGKRYI